MKIKFRNFIIEEDRNSFILTEMGKVPEKDSKGKLNKTAGEECIIDQTYPSTLERCFEKIAHKCKKGSKAEIELKDAAVTIKEINDAFMKELREELSKLTKELC